MSCIASFVKRNAKKRKALAYVTPNPGAVFADPTREDEHVQAAEHGGVSSDSFANGNAEGGDRKCRRLISFIRRSFEIAHITHAAGECRQTGLAIEKSLERVRVHLSRALQIEEHARIEISGTRGHGDSACGREAHGCIDRTPIVYCDDAGTIAEMSNDGTTCQFPS